MHQTSEGDPLPVNKIKTTLYALLVELEQEWATSEDISVEDLQDEAALYERLKVLEYPSPEIQRLISLFQQALADPTPNNLKLCSSISETLQLALDIEAKHIFEWDTKARELLATYSLQEYEDDISGILHLFFSFPDNKWLDIYQGYGSVLFSHVQSLSDKDREQIHLFWKKHTDLAESVQYEITEYLEYQFLFIFHRFFIMRTMGKSAREIQEHIFDKDEDLELSEFIYSEGEKTSPVGIKLHIKNNPIKNPAFYRDLQAINEYCNSHAISWKSVLPRTSLDIHSLRYLETRQEGVWITLYPSMPTPPQQPDYNFFRSQCEAMIHLASELSEKLDQILANQERHQLDIHSTKTDWPLIQNEQTFPSPFSIRFGTNQDSRTVTDFIKGTSPEWQDTRSFRFDQNPFPAFTPSEMRTVIEENGWSVAKDRV